MADLRGLTEKEKAQYNANKSVQAEKYYQQAQPMSGFGQGLLNVIADGEKPRAMLAGLLGGDTSALSSAWNEVKQLGNPSYMRNVKGINNKEAMNIALDANPVMATVVNGFGRNADDMASVLNKLHPNIDANLMGGNSVTLSKIIAKNRNSGDGTRFMDDFTKLADEKGLNVNLSPSADFGGNKNRLKDFYKRFGFVENKGKNKDFTINESMYREPSKNGLLALDNVIPKTQYELAHELAQKNAVEMLGLPANNTAMERAKALGFENDWFHGRYKDYDKIKDGRTFYSTKDPSYASIYAVEPTASSMGGKSISDFDNLQPNVMPLMIKTGDVLDTRTPIGKKVFDNDFYMKYGNGTPLTEKKLPDWVDAEDFGEMFADTGSKFKGVFADEGKIPTWEGGLRDRGVSAAVFNPSIVRSRFAAFDPARAHEADLLGNASPELLGLLGIGSGAGIGYAYSKKDKK